MRLPTGAVTALVVLAVAIAAHTAGAADWKTEKRELVTADGLHLTAWLSAPTDSKPAPLIGLLPMLGNTHESYRPFMETLQSRISDDTIGTAGPLPYLLNFDLRGHGESVQLADSSVSVESMGADQFAKIPGDVAEMVKQVLADSSLNIDLENVYVVGASIGANSAALLTELLPAVTRIALLSPGEDYRGLKPTSAVESFEGDILIFAARDDTYSHFSALKLGEANKEHGIVVLFDGKDHGTNLISRNAGAMEQLVDWLLAEPGSGSED